MDMKIQQNFVYLCVQHNYSFYIFYYEWLCVCMCVCVCVGCVYSWYLPRQGSFFCRNSSRATQPPPTRTMTVLRRMRTRRNFWESPNWKVKYMDLI